MKTSYCKLCDSEIAEQVFECVKCEMSICPQCVGEAKSTCMGMRDFLCPKCGEIAYLRISLPTERLPPEVQLQIAQKNNPEFSMGAVYSPSEDTRFRPNQRRRHGVKRRQVSKENTDDLDADLQRTRLRDRKPNP